MKYPMDYVEKALGFLTKLRGFSQEWAGLEESQKLSIKTKLYILFDDIKHHGYTEGYNEGHKEGYYSGYGEGKSGY